MKYAVKHADNTISILEVLKGSPEQYLQEGMTLVGPVSEEDESVPSSHAFREEWRQVAGGNIRVNMPLARAKKLEQVRAERDKRLLGTDAEYVKLHSQDQDLTAIKALKQALRDLPEAVELELAEISDADELATYEPEWP